MTESLLPTDIQEPCQDVRIPQPKLDTLFCRAAKWQRLEPQSPSVLCAGQSLKLPEYSHLLSLDVLFLSKRGGFERVTDSAIDEVNVSWFTRRLFHIMRQERRGLLPDCEK